MINLILTVILAAMIGGAGWYIYQSKKKGVKCIGCPQGCRISPDEAGAPGSCPGACSHSVDCCSRCGRKA